MSGRVKSYGSLADAQVALISNLSDACERLSPVGLLLVKAPEKMEIRLLAIPKVETISNQDALFLGRHDVDRLAEKLQLLQNAGAIRHLEKDHYEFFYVGLLYPFKLIVTTGEAWFANKVQASSGRDVYITLATAAKNQGMKWTPAKGGFEELKTGKVRIAASEEEVFEIVRLPYMPPENRNQVPVFAMAESGLPPSLTKEEMREWVASVPWTDTTCGGELHQYSFRTSGDERTFVHVVECVREYGYDGKYLRKKWRYLDLDEYFYFSCGGSIETTTLINRKKLRQEETPWVKNPEPWIPLK